MFAAHCFLRFPILVIIYGMVLLDLAAYFSVRMTVFFLESACYSRHNESLRRRLAAATTYRAWRAIGEELDAIKVSITITARCALSCRCPTFLG